MPKVFEKDGYKFAFYGNKHRPIHVHVRYGGGEAVFDLENEVELRESRGLKAGELSKAQMLAEKNKKMLIQKWREYFNGQSLLRRSRCRVDRHPDGEWRGDSFPGGGESSSGGWHDRAVESYRDFPVRCALA